MQRERSNDWYWALGLGSAVGAAVSVLLGNVLLALILVVGVGSLSILAARGPRQHSVRIDARGLSLDGTLYRFENMRSFWIDGKREGFDDERNHPHLYISTRSLLAPHISLPLQNGAQAQQISGFLKKYIPEEEQGPHFGEHIAQLLGL